MVNVNFETTQFHGAGYDKEIDHARLTGQLERVYLCLKAGAWKSLAQISDEADAPEASASAAIRSLRNEHGFIIEKSRLHDTSGTWLYRLTGRSECGWVMKKKKMKPIGDKEFFGKMMQALYAYAHCRDMINLIDLRKATDQWQDDMISRIENEGA